MIDTQNKIKQMLIDFGLCDDSSIIPFYPRVRDRDDISVFKCTSSEIILLSRSDHLNISHYTNKQKLEYWGAKDRETIITEGQEDVQRRAKQFQHLIKAKKWLDVGTGAGGVLDALSASAMETAAVEPQNFIRKCLAELGYNVFPAVADVPDKYYEVVSLFHVLEHFTDPVSSLLEIKNKMATSGKIIVEIPHARDVLLSLFNNDAFKAFTFWSEHLILHTRESITLLLEKTGFKNITVKGCQRYPLANHLYWLHKAKPGGHVEWDFLRTDSLDLEYEKMLSVLDKTDTLIAIAQK